jgi:predicted amidohydrolase YtcJ
MRLRHKQTRHTLIALALTSAMAHATTVIDNANGYTLNAQGDVVQFAALAFDDAGRILAVGTAAEVSAKAPQAQHVDMAGRTVLPGLIDAHGHVFGLGEMLTQLDLSATTSLPQALAAIGDYARANGQAMGVRGRGCNH